MITLPVSSSVYQSMVANIQQIHTNGDGTLCITPMQVQKTGHQHSINHNNLNSTSISGNLAIGGNCSVAPPCISSVNGSSFSNANNNSVGPSILANCNAPSSNSPFNSSPELSTPELHCDNNNPTNNNNNNNSNLLELCRVLSQSTNMNSANCQNVIFSPNFTTNDRKLTKCTKKPSAINRSQFFNFGSSSSFPSESNGIDRNDFLEQNIEIIDGNKSLHENDTNNNSNNGQNHHHHESATSNGNSSHDLKFVNTTNTTSTDQNAQKSNKMDTNTNPINITVQLGENETRSIKMECEIDVA